MLTILKPTNAVVVGRIDCIVLRRDKAMKHKQPLAKRRTLGGKAAARGLKVRVHSAKGRSLSSTRWLQRQLNDPYVARAKADGYRSRAAYKLSEINAKYRILYCGARVIDLGAAPGGWTQVAVAQTNANNARSTRPKGSVLAIDKWSFDAVAGAHTMVLDVSEHTPSAILTQAQAVCGGDWPTAHMVDVVLSDMAAAATGHKATDHIRTLALCEMAVDFACAVLADGGSFVAKVLAGGAENTLYQHLQRAFAKVVHVKPPASRSDSSEKYVVALGFRAGAWAHSQANKE